MSDPIRDSELMQRLAAGEIAAIGILYDRYSSVLFPIAVRILHDRAEAADVLHDAFVVAAERAAQYREERGSAIAWLVSLTRNLCIDRMRRRVRRTGIERDVLVHEPPPRAEGSDDQVQGAQVQHVITRLLEAIPELQRRTLELAFYEGLSYSEIAEREGVPLGTVKSRAARALMGLREALERDGLTLEALASESA